jgi:two-component sensor histidine kinase/PAS domain-containing protein
MVTTNFKAANYELTNDLVDKVLIVGSITGLCVFIVSLFPFDENTINADFFADIFGLTILFGTYFLRNKFELNIKMNVIISMIFLIYISDLLENGIYTPDTILVVLIPFFAVLIYSLKTTMIIYAICGISFIIIGHLFHLGVVSSPDYLPEEESIFRWYEHFLMLSVLTFIITLFMNKFNGRVYSLISNLAKQNDDLQERESLLSTVQDNFPRSYLLVIDNEQRIISTGGEEFKYGIYKAHHVLGKTMPELLVGYEQQNIDNILTAHKLTMMGRGQEFIMEFNRQTLQVKTSPLKNSKGEVHSILAVLENISERVATQKVIEENLQEKNVLLQEIHHRVKNNLAVVSGLLTLQSYHIDDPSSKTILGKSTNRILSIAKVHEMLYESKNFNNIPFNAYIDELANIILSSMNDEGKAIEFKTNIQVEDLSINHGVPLGIIFNELITNSVKYGFKNQEDNIISISVKPDGNNISVVYEDNGIGIEDFENAATKSLGFTLIRSLMEQIDAEYTYATEANFKLSFHFPSDSNLQSNGNFNS